MALNYPADIELFALVCIEAEYCKPKDKGLVKYVSDKIGRDFVATAESDKTLVVVRDLEQLLGRRLDTIHIVGGGSQNTFLCQLTADACNRPVVAGPVEATAIGNVLVQAIGLGLLGSLSQAREVVRQSFDVHSYEPRDPARWQEANKKFNAMLSI